MALVQNQAQRTKEDEEGYGLQLLPQAGSRNIADTLPMFTQATNLAGFEQATIVGIDYVCVHQEKNIPLNHDPIHLSQGAPAVKRHIARQEQ